MSKIEGPKSIKFFVGFIANKIALIDKVTNILEKKFGPADFKSDILEFNYTTYYNKELGEGLKRRFISFKKLINIENSFSVKVLTNKLEKKFSMQGKRMVNIDPGYICLSKLVLFTTKDFSHRIYLEKGIYAEVTLQYRNKTFQPCEWSYPDYRSDPYILFFNKVREGYATQLRCAQC